MLTESKDNTTLQFPMWVPDASKATFIFPEKYRLDHFAPIMDELVFAAPAAALLSTVQYTIGRSLCDLEHHLVKPVIDFYRSITGKMVTHVDVRQAAYRHIMKACPDRVSTITVTDLDTHESQVWTVNVMGIISGPDPVNSPHALAIVTQVSVATWLTFDPLAELRYTFDTCESGFRLTVHHNQPKEPHHA